MPPSTQKLAKRHPDANGKASRRPPRHLPQRSPKGEFELRREILQEAVEENVLLRQGRRFVRHDGGRRGASWRWALWAAPVLSLVALLGLAPPGFLADAGLSFADPFPVDGPTAAPAAETEKGESAASPDGTGSSAISDAVSADAASGTRTSLAEGAAVLQAAPEPIDVDVFPLEVRRVMIDPGHGGDDSGTQAGALAEKELTLDIARRLEKDLLSRGFEVRLTRRSDGAVSLRERTEMANAWRADLFVSIHINWIADRGVRGLETYYLGTTDDPYLEDLARRENRASGYSLADMRDLLESIYTDARTGESAQLAERVQESLYVALSRQNPALKNRGVKTAPFVVLTTTEMPAILAEVSCLSNREEARLLGRPLYREHIAGALSLGIRSYAADVQQIEEGNMSKISHQTDATR